MFKEIFGGREQKETSSSLEKQIGKARKSAQDKTAKLADIPPQATESAPNLGASLISFFVGKPPEKLPKNLGEDIPDTLSAADQGDIKNIENGNFTPKSLTA